MYNSPDPIATSGSGSPYCTTAIQGQPVSTVGRQSVRLSIIDPLTASKNRNSAVGGGPGFRHDSAVYFDNIVYPVISQAIGGGILLPLAFDVLFPYPVGGADPEFPGRGHRYNETFSRKGFWPPEAKLGGGFIFFC